MQEKFIQSVAVNRVTYTDNGKTTGIFELGGQPVASSQWLFVRTPQYGHLTAALNITCGRCPANPGQDDHKVGVLIDTDNSMVAGIGCRPIQSRVKNCINRTNT